LRVHDNNLLNCSKIAVQNLGGRPRLVAAAVGTHKEVGSDPLLPLALVS